MTAEAGTEPATVIEGVRDSARTGAPLILPVGQARGVRHHARIGLAIAVTWLGLAVVMAVIGPLVAPDSSNDIDVNNIAAGISLHHWLGTDQAGRDVLSRLILGTRSSLIGVLLAIGIALLVGGIWGLVSGYGPRMIDEVLMRLADSILSFPALVLAVAIIGALGPSLVHAMSAIGLIMAPSLARLVRGEVLKVRNADYVLYARRCGIGPVRTAIQHVLPNIAGPVVVQAVLFSSIALVAEAGLCFLGLGPQPPSPNWGASLGDAFQYIEQWPWQMLPPGLAIVFTALSINTVGDRLHQLLAR